MPLTDIRIKALKPTDKPIKVTDAAGLYLLVHPNGGKYWRLKYRYAGKEKSLAIGVYILISSHESKIARRYRSTTNSIG